jgi:hypothetical protein
MNIKLKLLSFLIILVFMTTIAFSIYAEDRDIALNKYKNKESYKNKYYL